MNGFGDFSRSSAEASSASEQPATIVRPRDSMKDILTSGPPVDTATSGNTPAAAVMDEPALPSKPIAKTVSSSFSRSAGGFLGGFSSGFSDSGRDSASLRRSFSELAAEPSPALEEPPAKRPAPVVAEPAAEPATKPHVSRSSFSTSFTSFGSRSTSEQPPATDAAKQRPPLSRPAAPLSTSSGGGSSAGVSGALLANSDVETGRSFQGFTTGFSGRPAERRLSLPDVTPNSTTPLEGPLSRSGSELSHSGSELSRSGSSAPSSASGSASLSRSQDGHLSDGPLSLADLEKKPDVGLSSSQGTGGIVRNRAYAALESELTALRFNLAKETTLTDQLRARLTATTSALQRSELDLQRAREEAAQSSKRAADTQVSLAESMATLTASEQNFQMSLQRETNQRKIVENSLAVAETQLKELRAALELHSQTSATLKQDLQESGKLIESTEFQARVQEQDFKSLQLSLESERALRMSLDQQLEHLKKEFAGFQQEATSKETRLATELAHASAAVESLSAQVASLQGELATSQETITRLQADVHFERTTAEAAARDSSLALSQAEHDNRQVRQQESTQTTELAEVRRKLAATEAELAASRAEATASRAVADRLEAAAQQELLIRRRLEEDSANAANEAAKAQAHLRDFVDHTALTLQQQIRALHTELDAAGQKVISATHASQSQAHEADAARKRRAELETSILSMLEDHRVQLDDHLKAQQKLETQLDLERKRAAKMESDYEQKIQNLADNVYHP
ncbi:hypothetical protein H696_04544 [Fonticula alba]|uniref:Uncharacterized protein n=1 Tax=Fonticula alba TaxID=691883 RepID=A0A058Z4B6_FONAL|nr:hypothetical protein H696_04544 [Fonticula alba]KCV69129.1 hypothetical protein H696_04544 [Fonticula alba]|eukprot:XP_009496700.1 hypothetical protein H696_04544 [Fonticula alba]